MLKSLVLSSPALFFPQAMGACYHYSPTTAALLYEVTVVRHRGAHSPGHSVALSNMRSCLELSGTCRLAALAHQTGQVINAAMWMAGEDGQYEWWRMSELPWLGIPRTAAIVHVRSLPCPLRAYTRPMPVATRIASISHTEFLSFLHEWIPQQPYYFPAIRQAELAARGFLDVVRSVPDYQTKDSLPSFACHVLFTEVGNARTPSPDLFDENGNAKPSKTAIDPESRVMRGGRNEKRIHLPRAALVNELFTHESAYDWPGVRLDGNVTNDRVENVVMRTMSMKHPIPYMFSKMTADAVFPYKQQLPTSLYFTRSWRYGIDRLAFDIDATL